jgi:hypothetical protein
MGNQKNLLRVSKSFENLTIDQGDNTPSSKDEEHCHPSQNGEGGHEFLQIPEFLQNASMVSKICFQW